MDFFEVFIQNIPVLLAIICAIIILSVIFLVLYNTTRSQKRKRKNENDEIPIDELFLHQRKNNGGINGVKIVAFSVVAIMIALLLYTIVIAAIAFVTFAKNYIGNTDNNNSSTEDTITEYISSNDNNNASGDMSANEDFTEDTLDTLSETADKSDESTNPSTQQPTTRRPVVTTTREEPTAAATTVAATTTATTTTAKPPKTEPPPKLTYDISLNPSAKYTFPSTVEGYETQLAYSVAIKNTGNQSTGALTITLSGENGDSFTLSKTNQSSIRVNGSDSFSVAPKNGLTVGTYTAKITVSGNNITSLSFNIEFTVQAKHIYGISLNPSADYAFPKAVKGYKTQPAYNVAIKNTGNQSTGTLTITLSGANGDGFTLSKTNLNSINVDGSDSFTVAPKNGLPAGTYSATVTVSGGTNITPQSFNVSFEVSSSITILGTEYSVDLTNLNLSLKKEITSADIEPLRYMTNLIGLDLSYNKITSVSALKDLTNLTTLNLSHNQISDVSALKSLTNLKWLYLSGNQISESQIKELQSALPDCKISN